VLNILKSTTTLVPSGVRDQSRTGAHTGLLPNLQFFSSPVAPIEADMTSRYQLEAFVDELQGNKPVHWITPESSIAQMETIDAIYTKTGLPKRQGSLPLEKLRKLF